MTETSALPLGPILLVAAALLLSVLFQVLAAMLGLMLGVVLVVVIAAYLLAARISAPMKVLSDALRQAAGGNLSQRITEKRNDELGQMFIEFNKMADAIENLRDENRVLSQTLGGRAKPAIQSGDVPPAVTGGNGASGRPEDEELASTRVVSPPA